MLDTLDGDVENLVYYIIAASDLYRDVCEVLSNPNLLKYREFTDYLINVTILQVLTLRLFLWTKQIITSN